MLLRVLNEWLSLLNAHSQSLLECANPRPVIRNFFTLDDVLSIVVKKDGVSWKFAKFVLQILKSLHIFFNFEEGFCIYQVHAHSK
jgi:hypothetical protein